MGEVNKILNESSINPGNQFTVSPWQKERERDSNLTL